VRREDGFTLIELLVVAVLIGILTATALGFHTAARDRASDAAAKSNLRVAVPALEAYQGDNGTYAGVTLADLQTAYSPGVQGIVIVSADDSGYCLSSTVSGHTWYKRGPDGQITTTNCP
jgi:prepilin-type N-terminal cleavage/methylation domain-containing protein